MKRKLTILDEIHEYRERLAREYGYDLRRMAEALQRHETELRSREFIVGHSLRGRLLLVCFTEREQDIVRLISAWKATRKERSDYEKHTKS
jgi:uncharacterized DUF497 family protein